MHLIKSWGIIASEQWGVPEPDWPQYLVGVVNGNYIMSDEITSIKQESGYKVVTCGNKEYKVTKNEIDPKYEAAFPGAYRDLKGKENA